ncbi:MAG: hypothetical protein ACOZNI_09830 [Myxococcota bacterium]
MRIGCLHFKEALLADEFDLTSRAIKVTGASKQALQDALEISSYDQLDAVCTVDGIEGGPGTGLVIKLITGMQKETELGWVTLISFTAANLAAVGASDIKTASQGLLKYVRWEVTGLGGATSFVFDIGGMLRKLA